MFSVEVFRNVSEFLNYIEKLVMDLNTTYMKIQSVGFDNFIINDNLNNFRLLRYGFGTTTFKFDEIRTFQNGDDTIAIYIGRDSQVYFTPDLCFVSRNPELNTYQYLFTRGTELYKRLIGSEFTITDIEIESCSSFSLTQGLELKSAEYKQPYSFILNSDLIWAENNRFKIIVPTKSFMFSSMLTPISITRFCARLTFKYSYKLNCESSPFKCIDVYSERMVKYAYLLFDGQKHYTTFIDELMKTVQTFIRNIPNADENITYVQSHDFNAKGCFNFYLQLRVDDNVTIYTPTYKVTLVNETLLNEL